MNESELQALKAMIDQFSHGLVPDDISDDLPISEDLKALKRFYREITNFVEAIIAGNLEAKFDYKGPIAGALKTLQANLKHLAWQADEVANGDFSQRIDSLGIISFSFNQMIDNLRDMFNRLELQNLEMTNYQREFEKDLKLAEDAQVKMMSFLKTTDFTLGDKYYAALQRVSGDLYYEFMDQSGDLNIFVGDATGHGIAAGLVTMMTRSAIESVVNEPSITEKLYKINNLLLACLPDEIFITGVLARISPTGRFTVGSAGHLPVVIARRENDMLQFTRDGGMPLGMFEAQKEDFVIEELELLPGDRICFFTDGITEVSNRQERFGFDRLCATLQKYRNDEIETAVAEVIGTLWDFCADNGFEDDALLIMHEFTGIRPDTVTRD